MGYAKVSHCRSLCIPFFEFEMVGGGYLKCEKLSAAAMSLRQRFSMVGIQTDLGPQRTCEAHPVVDASNENSALLARLSFATILQHAKRNFTFSRGYPRREVMLPHPALRGDFLNESKG